MRDPADDVAPAPVLSVVRGEPTDQEVAALVAVLTARVARAEHAPRTASRWADPGRRLRAPLQPGTGAWGTSALPH